MNTNHCRTSRKIKTDKQIFIEYGLGYGNNHSVDRKSVRTGLALRDHALVLFLFHIIVPDLH